MFIWIEGSLNPDEVGEGKKNDEYRFQKVASSKHHIHKVFLILIFPSFRSM